MCRRIIRSFARHSLFVDGNMNLNRKTLLLVIAGTALLVLIAFGVLWYMNRPDKTKMVRNLFGILPQTGERGDGGSQEVLPPSGNETLTGGGEGGVDGDNEIKETTEAELLQIIKKPILGATLSADNAKIMYYTKSGGKLEAVDFSGETQEQISPLTIVGIFDVVWQNAKRHSVISYLDSANAKRFINETATTGVVFLPEGIRSAVFSPDSRSLAYLLRKSEITQLITATETGGKPQVVYETLVPDFSLLWIAPKKILLQSAPSSHVAGIVYLFDTGTKTLEKIFSDIRGGMTIASPDGAALLTSFIGGDGRGALSLTNQKGENAQSITPATMSEKCVFTKDAKTIYCAVSQDAQELPDAWFRGDIALEDQFMRIPADTLVAEVISDKTQFDATNLFLSPDGKYLFFQDKNDLTLWRLKLK